MFHQPSPPYQPRDTGMVCSRLSFWDPGHRQSNLEEWFIKILDTLNANFIDLLANTYFVTVNCHSWIFLILCVYSLITDLFKFLQFTVVFIYYYALPIFRGTKVVYILVKSRVQLLVWSNICIFCKYLLQNMGVYYI